MKILADDLIPMATGAAFLATGGGGDPRYARLAVQALLETTGSAELLTLADLPDDNSVISVGMSGSPSVGIEKLPNGLEPLWAVQMLEDHLNIKADALIAFEVGGGNSLIPFLAAARMGIPVLDADGMGRAFPEMQMETFSIYGVSGSPMAVVDEFGDGGVLTARDDVFGEKLLRNIGLAMGGECYCAQYVMSGEEAKRVSVAGSLTLAMRVGEQIIRHRGNLEAFLIALAETLTPTSYGRLQLISQGKVVGLDRQIIGGYDQGTVSIETFDGGGRLELLVKNEFLVAELAGERLCMVPDLICVIDVETLEPIPAERVRYGQRVAVLGIGAPDILTTETALPVVGPRGFGFDYDFVALGREELRDD